MSQIDQSKEITFKIHKAVFLLDKMCDQILQDRLGLGFSQFLVLMTLAGMPKAPQKSVAKSLDQTQAAVSRQLDLLVDQGYVSRERNPDSRREYVLSLTKSGEKKFRQGLSEIDQRYDKLFQIWKKDEKNNLLGCLDKLLLEIRTKGVKKICGETEKSR
ncbi:MAG: MarR family transcriptional regulator [Candidatus Doudnabacteria bacterium]|nr:MarR family transcriptional regulator [Candidatus Doudnabacteria bacterium]